MTSTPTSETDLVPEVAFSRRSFLAGGAAVGTGLLLGHMPAAQASDSTDGHPIKQYDISANGIILHVTEQGEGPVVLFCHGFPDTSYTWRRQMQAVAAAGYRAIAPDMRGYGRSSAPVGAALYTPLRRPATWSICLTRFMPRAPSSSVTTGERVWLGAPP